MQNVRPQQGYLMLAAYVDAESYAAKKAAQRLKDLRLAVPAESIRIIPNVALLMNHIY